MKSFNPAEAREWFRSQFYTDGTKRKYQFQSSRSQRMVYKLFIGIHRPSIFEVSIQPKPEKGLEVKQ